MTTQSTKARFPTQSAPEADVKAAMEKFLQTKGVTTVKAKAEPKRLTAQ